MGSPDDAFRWIAFCMALIVAIIFLLRRSHRYFGRRGQDQSPVVSVSRVKGLSFAAANDAGAQLIREEVRMHETARELSARLDSKISVLEYLTGTAQQQIDRLEQLIEKAERIAEDRLDGAAGKGRRDDPGAGES